MELAPPSYSDAIRRNHWGLVAPYLMYEDLIQACLVCKAWHSAFTPQLWGSPMSNARSRFEDPWFALRRFEGVLLDVARLEIRELTHTLEVPVDLDSLHISVGSRWFYNLLSRLPRLQSLTLRGVQYLDQKSLSWAFTELKRIPAQQSLQVSHNLRLLDATSCRNINEHSLSQISELFPNLVYLDLSGIHGRNIFSAASLTGNRKLKSIEALHHLKVLKLEGGKLNDSMVRAIASTTKKRIRSLDIRHNLLTDSSLVELLRNSLVTTEDLSIEQQTYNPRDEPPGYKKLQTGFRQNVRSLDTELYTTLTTGPTGRIALEDEGEPGITQLRFSAKALNLRTLVALMDCPNLQYLDVESESIILDHNDDRVPCCANLEYLRVHHSLVTKFSDTRQLARWPQYPTTSKSSLAAVRKLRKEFTEEDHSDWTKLISSMPKLHTLVLTGVPEYSVDPTLVQGIITFLRNCGAASSLAASQAHFEFHADSKPTNVKSRAEEGRLRALSPLSKIVFELISPEQSNLINRARGWNLPEFTKSVTEDRDSQAVWGVANNDYSFFDHPEDDGEPDARLDASRTSSGKPTILDEDKKRNVVAALIDFRKSSREKYNSLQASGKQYETVHDYLDATVSLQRS